MSKKRAIRPIRNAKQINGFRGLFIVKSRSYPQGNLAPSTGVVRMVKLRRMNRDRLNVQRAVQEACDITDGPAALARAIGVSPPFITYLTRGERDVSIELGIEIEKVTHGKVRIERLCPQHRATIEYLGRRSHLLADA
jgi:DNA-binding transcriptional regulator YdaS (Cro superfamily)